MDWGARDAEDANDPARTARSAIAAPPRTSKAPSTSSSFKGLIWMGVLVLALAALPLGAWVVDAMRSEYVPTDQQQADECDGVPAAGPVIGDPTPTTSPALPPLQLLSKDATVVSGVVCPINLQGSQQNGLQQVESVVPIPPGDLTRLVAALRLTDHSGGSHACNTYLVAVPDFVLTLADGGTVRPGVPGDGCHPRKEVLDALAAIATAPAASTTPVSQVASPQEWETGCWGEAKPPAIWFNGFAETTGWRLPSSGATAVCRYSPDEAIPTGAAEPGVTGHLAATGTPSASALDATLRPSLTPGLGCAPTGTHDQPPGDWIIVVPTPSPAEVSTGTSFDANPAAVIELGGCRRVVDVGTGDVIGYLSADQATSLAALADRPAG